MQVRVEDVQLLEGGFANGDRARREESTVNQPIVHLVGRDFEMSCLGQARSRAVHDLETGARRAGGGVLLQGRDDVRQIFRFPEVIVIEESDELSARLADPGVARAGHPFVCLPDEADSGAERRGHLRGIIL